MYNDQLLSAVLMCRMKISNYQIEVMALTESNYKRSKTVIYNNRIYCQHYRDMEKKLENINSAL